VISNTQRINGGPKTVIKLYANFVEMFKNKWKRKWTYDIKGTQLVDQLINSIKYISSITLKTVKWL
jgi:uncharacterized membrane protein YqhA